MSEDMERHRSNDDSFITIKRDVPLWAILSALVAVVGSGVSLQIGQNDSAKRIQELSAQVAQLNANYASEIGGKVKLQLMVESLQQRVSVLEARK
jgi:hypothetical protein